MGDTTAMTEQPNVAKAQRIIVKACDVCRKKKIRCEPTVEGCAQCTKHGTRCHFTPLKTKRKPRKPAGFKYITSLEERLKKMEGLVENAHTKRRVEGSSFSPPEYVPFHIFDSNAFEITQSERGLQHSRIAALAPPVLEADFGDDSLVTTLSHLPRFQGDDQTSGKSTLAHEPLLSSLQSFQAFKGDLAPSPFPLPSFHELPTKSVALELIEDTFRSFNWYFPLFDQQHFLQQFQNDSLGPSPRDPGWWAIVNVVLALAHRFRAMRTLETAYENAQSCGYIQNALAVVPELNMLQRSLPAVQALIGMAIVLQGTPNPHASSVLIAAAVRLAQAMGLHKRAQDPSLTEEQIEERRRVFWIAYLLDKDISLRMGQPFAQDDDDMDVELPLGSVSKLPLCRDGLRSINLLNSRIALAVIQGQIYKRLYSVRATRQSKAQKTTVAQELNVLLSFWRRSVPIDFEQDQMVPLQGPLTEELIHLLILHFTYIHGLVMIDRHLTPTEPVPGNTTPETDGAFTCSESICVVEVRKAARLIQRTPPGDYAVIWLLLHPFFAAVTVLLHHVLRSPAAPHARSDLHLVKPFLRLVAILAGEGRRCSRSEEAKRILQLCRDLHGRAQEAVEYAGMRTVSE